MYTRRTFILVWTLLVILVGPSYALSTEEIVKKNRSAVVEIVTQDKNGSTLATGTGFFISNDGKLVTNRHVVEGAASITAKSDQGSFFVCQGILAEPKDADLAILKFEAKNVLYLELAPESRIAAGQKIIVIGNPLGLEGSVSEGIISAVRNELGLVQISAPISPGSSGSPVMTEEGRVIGVATLQSKVGQNLNFAIPVEKINATLADIDQKKPVTPLAEATSKVTTSENEAPEVFRARAFLASYDCTEAMRVLKEYLAKNPTDAEAWVVYAEACSGGYHRWEEAADAAQKAVDLEPQNLNRWRVLTYCLTMLTPGPPNDSDRVLLTRLKQVAEHDLAMGDDFNMAYHALIRASESLGDKEQAAKLREQYQLLEKSPGELADYIFGQERRYFGKQMMFPADQVAKERGMELTDDALFLDLKGKGHSFTIWKDAILVLVDGVSMNHNSVPAKYKHQRYFLDAGLVDFVFDGLLNSKKIVNPPFLPGFRIDNVYLEANLPVQATDEEHLATQKLIDAALKLDPNLFKRKTAAAAQEHAVVINVRCEQNKDSDHEYRFSSKLGNQWSEQYIDFPSAVESTRSELANLLQIQLARRILNDFPKPNVVTSTTFQYLPHPATNPTLLVDISLPESKIASDDTYEKIVRCLADTVAKVSSEISGTD